MDTDYFHLVLQQRPAWAPVSAPWITRLTVWTRLPRSPGALTRVLAVAWDEAAGTHEVGLGAQIATRGFGKAWNGSTGPASPVFWMIDALQGQ